MTSAVTPAVRARLIREAEQLLRENDRGGYTIPSAQLYPHQWAWDSAFSAIGWSHLDLDRALGELELLMGGIWEDGRVPHILFHVPSDAYFPGPEFWGTVNSSSITQPPVWAIAVLKILQRGGDRERIRSLLPALEASHFFFSNARDPLRMGAVSVSHPWESGRDNCPAWDDALESVDPELAPSFHRKDIERVSDPSQRPTDLQYLRYAALVDQIRLADFGPGPFAVYDPMMTTVLILAEQALMQMAESLGETDFALRARSRSIRLRMGLSALWDERSGRYGFLHGQARSLQTPDVLASYMPLILEEDAQRRSRLIDGLQSRYLTPVPLPSTAPEDPGFVAQSYWRGPVWWSEAWLILPALSPAMRETIQSRLLDCVAREGFWEYFHPMTGQGLGSPRFTWTAALTLDWLLDG